MSFLIPLKTPLQARQKSTKAKQNEAQRATSDSEGDEEEEGKPIGPDICCLERGKKKGQWANMTFPLGQFIINASQPASDKIFDVSAFEKFLQDRIKVDGRTNNLGDNVVIQQSGDGKIEVIAHNELSGRYLKYLYGPPFSLPRSSRSIILEECLAKNLLQNRTKKFLKKQQLRDWLRVVSTSRGVYELKFFNVVNDDADEDDE